VIIDGYEFETDPFDHQLDGWVATRDEEIFAIWWEQGTGKTKLVLDTAAWLYEHGKIDALFVLAPNGVHRNWITDELPAHLPKRIERTTHFYTSRKANTLKHKRACRAVVESRGLAVLAMSYDALMTAAGLKLAGQMLTKRKCLYVADESTRIKSPGAKRTKRVIATGKRATYKRTLTGTPVTQGPLDVYAQMRFLAADFWKPHELESFTTFKSYFAIFDDIMNQQTGRSFKKLRRYKNLSELKAIVSGVSHRVTKDGVLDLPPKLYQKRYVEMNPEQKRIYRGLRQNYRAMLDAGEEINAPLALVRITRLHQVVCGFVVPDDTNELMEIEGPNYRLAAMEEIRDDLPHQAIVWARFNYDVDRLMDLLGKRAVRYDGRVSDENRARAKDAFQGGESQFFVGKTAAAGIGLTLHAARSVVYYSNTFSLEDRLQSEDRAHRIGQNFPVSYIDLVTPGTVDQKIVSALRAKLDVSRVITGDAYKEWI
jgi:SNF2 family DNA or RNA helicase